MSTTRKPNTLRKHPRFALEMTLNHWDRFRQSQEEREDFKSVYPKVVNTISIKLKTGSNTLFRVTCFEILHIF